MNNHNDPYLPYEAEIIERIQESPTIFTLSLRFTDPELSKTYAFLPGQFNMVYLYGVGEVAISIVSDPMKKDRFDHTIRAVGRVTQALEQLKPGEQIGIRGPFGRGWPLELAKGKNVIILTGGLGCAPVVSAINYIIARIDEYKSLKILQGVKHSHDFIFYNRYQQWYQVPKTEVIIAADKADLTWPWRTGRVTDMIASLDIHADNSIVMMCGPEIMMRTAIAGFVKKNIPENNLYLSMERNMECAVGHCGHCQYGGLFICKNGPVFSFPEIKNLFNVSGF